MRAVLTLHSPSLARAYYADDLWGEDTFYSLLARNAREQGERVALMDAQQSCSWKDLLARVDALAARFETFGLKAGDRVSLWLSDRAETVIAFLACSRLGLACNPSLHKTYSCSDVITLLKQLDTNLLVTEPGWGVDRNKVDFSQKLKEVDSLKAVLDPMEFPQAGMVPEAGPCMDPDIVAYLAFTSGTTGRPKCVMHSANTLLSNARDLVQAWKIDKEHRILTLSPLSHHIGWVAASQWLCSGCCLIVGAPPAGQKILDWIIETDATYVMGVPTQAIDILSDQKSRGQTRLGKVRIFYMAGAPIPQVVSEEFVKQGIGPQNVYGMTENSSHQFTYPDDEADVWTQTCGRGGRGYEIKIVDIADPDRNAAPGEVGQIAGRGPNLMLGYFGNQTATEQSFNSDGWFLSGDLGSIDEKGNLRIEGRLKDLIIRGGHNIYPSHIEDLALRHAKVKMATAFPVPDERLGEKVCLAVQGDVAAGDVMRHLERQGLSKSEMPEWFVFVQEFPLTPSGKILKRELMHMQKTGRISPFPVRDYLKKEA